MLKSESRGLPWLKTILFLTAFSLVLSAAVPEGWIIAGNRAGDGSALLLDRTIDYESSVDSQTVYNGRSSAYLRYGSSREPADGGFGRLMQRFSANAYIGQRVRFSGYVKADAVQNWAGLCMWVVRGSGASTKVLSFDIMHDRPIKGSTEWQFYEVVLDVPEGSTGIFLGITLSGKGTVWLNSASFEIVSKSVPLTGGPARPIPDGPTNLSFDK